MKVVLTGGTGLVGKALHQRLLQEGYEVTLLARPEWDGEKDVPPAEILRGCDVLIHLAGENIASERWTKARKKHLIDSRVKGAQNLKEGLKRSAISPKIFITASAVGIYGDRGDEMLFESSSPGHDFLADLCHEWEATADSFPATYKIKLRFGVVLSGRGGFLHKVSRIFKLAGASRLGSGKQWVSWIHIDDLVGIIVWLLKDGQFDGAINVVAPHPVTNSQLTQELKLALRTFSAPPVPTFALKILYGELAQALLSSQRAIPQRLEQNGYRWKFPTLKEALDGC